MDITSLIFGNSAQVLAQYSRYLAPLLAVLVLVRCVRSMLSERYEPETWAYLYLPGEIMVPLRHWECIIGRSKSADCYIGAPNVTRTHACLIRSAEGDWTAYNLGRAVSQVNGKDIPTDGAPIADADVLTMGGVPARFVDLTEEERASLMQYRHSPGRRVRPGATLLFLTVYQILLALQQTVYNLDAANGLPAMAFGVLAAAQWMYYLVMRAAGRKGFETETLAFFLCTLGMSVAASSDAGGMLKQVVLTMVGLFLFIALGLWMRDLKRLKALRWPAAVGALVLLAVNLVISKAYNGAQNWITIGGFSLQPSEFVKFAYVYAGAATLDRLFVNRNLFMFIGFSAACVGALALMGDFGSALIFFATFLVISFMRSGSFATVFLAVAGAVLAGFLVLTIKPYILARFQTWGHAWDDVYNSGYQQVRAMSAAASGGLFGQGAGNGWFIHIYAAETDLVWAVICEELGLITGLCAIASLLAMAAFVVRNAASGRSSYFVIAASSSISLLMVQMALNVFGSLDILPFTGVTFPFISLGGSSLLSCWMLLAFIKACDVRANASFAVKLPENFSGGAGPGGLQTDAPPRPEQAPDDGDWIREDGGDEP